MASHIEVMNNWLNKTGKAHEGHNVFYRCPRAYTYVIYSYGFHFPMARHTVTSKGSPAILITNRGYSSSTNKQLSQLRGVIGYDRKDVFTIDNVLADNKVDHKQNYVKIIGCIKEILKVAARARKYSQMHIDSAKRLASMLDNYSKAFKLGYKKVVLFN